MSVLGLRSLPLNPAPSTVLTPLEWIFCTIHPPPLLPVVKSYPEPFTQGYGRRSPDPWKKVWPMKRAHLVFFCLVIAAPLYAQTITKVTLTGGSITAAPGSVYGEDPATSFLT